MTKEKTTSGSPPMPSPPRAAQTYTADERIKECNAIIVGARITTEDYGLLTAWLDLDYGALHQSFGGYGLYLPPSFDHHRMNAGYAGHWLWRVMEVAGVTRWDKIVGKTIRVRSEWGKVHAIGHIVKDDWFDPEKDFGTKERPDAAD